MHDHRPVGLLSDGALSQPARESSLGADVGRGAHLSLDVARSQLGCVRFSLDLFIPDVDAYRMLSLDPNVREEKMQNGQPVPDNVLSIVLPGIINMEADGISSLSTKDLYYTVTHNGCEEKINNGQPAPDNFLSAITPGLINLSGADIPPMSTRDQYATVTHSVHEEKMEDGQPAPDNVLSAIPPGFINMAGAGIPAMSTNDLYATITHNAREEKMQKGQPAPHNFLSAVASGLIIMAGAGITAMSTMDLYITATHNVHEEKMKNGQQASDNSLSTVPPGRINLSGAGISSRSTRDLYATVIHDVQEEEMENGQTPPDGFLSNSAPTELINMTGSRMPHNTLDSFSYDFTSLSKDELLYKPDSNEFVVDIKNYSVSAGDPPVTGMPSVETVPNTPQISPAMAKKINDDIKYQLMKKFKGWAKIFILLEEVQGSMKVKGQFVQFAIKEAARFKKVLIQQLEEMLKEIDSHWHLRKVKHMRKK
ncbi:PREDICTED: sarcoma antigen 1-like [Colobus angolensis palliatus]|uniref:sarcoma antigen 1-like n=1 Tax=Colobus angolensis palliatus TaxID=336983 RepID=UPI0005F56947|nr:PREDICTED: sarcoma antigen 1-like [Colobus angolensis palliatus]